MTEKNGEQPIHVTGPATKGVEIMLSVLQRYWGEFATNQTIIKVTDTRPGAGAVDRYVISPKGHVPAEAEPIDRPGLRRERRIYGSGIDHNLEPNQPDPIVEMWGIVTGILADESISDPERIIFDRLHIFASGIPRIRS